MNQIDLVKLVREGEGQRAEFKAGDTPRIAETACALANTEGGTILVGISDDGTVSGITKDVERKVSQRLGCLQPMPHLQMQRLPLAGREVLAIVIGVSDTLVALGGTAYVRIGSTNRALSLDELLVRAVAIGTVRFDEAQSSLGPENVDLTMVRKFLTKRQEVRGVKARGTPKENLRALRVVIKGAKGPRMSYAGVLFFTPDPAEHIPGASLRIVQMDAHLNPMQTWEFRGPVWKIADDATRQLLSLLGRFELRVGAARRSILEYPDVALREAIVNALAHRNYAVPADVRIFLMPDSLTIRSPGSFPPGVDIDEPEHIPRNPLLCGLLYDIGYIERYGYGLRKIREEVAAHPYVEVQFNSSPAKVDVIFKKKPWAGISEEEQIVVSVLRAGAMSGAEVAKTIKVSTPTALKRLRHLEGLGVVERSGSGRSTLFKLK